MAYPTTGSDNQVIQHDSTPSLPEQSSVEQCSKPLLVDDYGGLYYPNLPNILGDMIEGSLEVKLPTIWTHGKEEVGRVREEKKRSEKIREEEEREERRCRRAKR